MFVSMSKEPRVGSGAVTIGPTPFPDMTKGVPNQGLDCFVSYGSFFCISFVFLVYVVLCLIVFGCQYN